MSGGASENATPRARQSGMVRACLPAVERPSRCHAAPARKAHAAARHKARRERTERDKEDGGER